MWGHFQITYELLNLRALEFSSVNKIHTFQYMGKTSYVELQRYPLKFHTKYLTHTLKDMILYNIEILRAHRFKSLYPFFLSMPSGGTHLRLRLRQNGCHFSDDIFNCFFFNENVWILFKIHWSLFPINNFPALVRIMAWRRPGDKPLSEPMTHIWITQPQCVDGGIQRWIHPMQYHVTCSQYAIYSALGFPQYTPSYEAAW